MPLGLRAIRPKKFQVIDPDRTVRSLRANMRKYLQEVAAQMRVYPPEQPGQSYVRTHQLQRGWSDSNIKIDADGGGGSLVNPVAWATVVQGPRFHGERFSAGERQSADMRRRGWQSITDVAARTRPRFTQLINQSIRGDRKEE